MGRLSCGTTFAIEGVHSGQRSTSIITAQTSAGDASMWTTRSM
jgi:hypothetical protein